GQHDEQMKSSKFNGSTHWKIYTSNTLFGNLSLEIKFILKIHYGNELLFGSFIASNKFFQAVFWVLVLKCRKFKKIGVNHVC
ncbi:hypothetical protein DVA76_19500, partial [Acinetobacter baumannii]